MDRLRSHQQLRSVGRSHNRGLGPRLQRRLPHSRCAAGRRQPYAGCGRGRDAAGVKSPARVAFRKSMDKPSWTPDRTYGTRSAALTLKERLTTPDECKSGSSNPADRAKALKCLSVATAPRTTNRVIAVSATSACGLRIYPVLGDSNCRMNQNESAGLILKIESDAEGSCAIRLVERRRCPKDCPTAGSSGLR